MGRSVEKSGRTVNDAIAAALDELKLTIDDVHVDVLNEGKTGLFGLLSGKPAKVRVSELEEEERIPQPDYTDDVDDINISGDKYVETDRKEHIKTVLDDAAEDADEAEDAYETDEEEELEFSDDGEKNGISHTDTYGKNYSDVEPVGILEEDNRDESTFDYDYEINRAIDYLNEIFRGIHISVEMTAELVEDGILINVESDDSGILIGHRGETLESLQYLLNLYMNKGRNAFIRVSVDVENYKKKREAALIRLAGQIADKVVRLRRNFTLDAMNSYERRIIHSVLQNHPKVETYSVGEDPNRKVVVTLKSRGSYSSR